MNKEMMPNKTNAQLLKEYGIFLEILKNNIQHFDIFSPVEQFEIFKDVIDFIDIEDDGEKIGIIIIAELEKILSSKLKNPIYDSMNDEIGENEKLADYKNFLETEKPEFDGLTYKEKNELYSKILDVLYIPSMTFTVDSRMHDIYQKRRFKSLTNIYPKEIISKIFFPQFHNKLKKIKDNKIIHEEYWEITPEQIVKIYNALAKERFIVYKENMKPEVGMTDALYIFYALHKSNYIREDLIKPANDRDDVDIWYYDFIIKSFKRKMEKKNLGEFSNDNLTDNKNKIYHKIKKDEKIEHIITVMREALK